METEVNGETYGGRATRSYAKQSPTNDDRYNNCRSITSNMYTRSLTQYSSMIIDLNSEMMTIPLMS